MRSVFCACLSTNRSSWMRNRTDLCGSIPAGQEIFSQCIWWWWPLSWSSQSCIRRTKSAPSTWVGPPVKVWSRGCSLSWPYGLSYSPRLLLLSWAIFLHSPNIENRTIISLNREVDGSFWVKVMRAHALKRFESGHPTIWLVRERLWLGEDVLLRWN